MVDIKKLPFFLLLPALLCGCPTVGHGEFDVAAYLDGAPGTKVRLSYTEQDGASEDGRSNRLTEKEAELPLIVVYPFYLLAVDGGQPYFQAEFAAGSSVRIYLETVARKESDSIRSLNGTPDPQTVRKLLDGRLAEDAESGRDSSQRFKEAAAGETFIRFGNPPE